MKLKLITISLLLFLLFLWVPRNVNANTEKDVSKPLIVFLGGNLNDYIKYDNYVVISNTVNVNQVGTYSITYRHIETLEEVKKIVYVIDTESFTTERIYSSKKDVGFSYTLVDSISINDSLFWLTNLKRNNSVLNNYYLSINDSKSITIHQNSKANIKDMERVNNDVLIIGDQPNDINGDYNLLYFDVTSDFNKRIKEIKSFGRETATCIAGNENYVFLGGYIEENVDILNINREVKDKDSFILTIDRTTQEVLNTTIYGMDGDDSFIDFKFLDNYLYAIQELNNNNFRLLKIDIFGNIMEEQLFQFNYGYTNPNLKVLNNKLYLSYKYYEYVCLDYVDVIEEVSDTLKRQIIYNNYDALRELVDYEISSDGIIKAIYQNKNKTNGYSYKLFMGDKVILEYYSSNKHLPIAIHNDYVVLSNTDSVYVNKIDTFVFLDDIKKEIDPKVHKNETLNDYRFYINGMKRKHTNNLELDISNNLFGRYNVDYYFEDDIDYLKTVKTNVLPFVGIENNKVYNIGVSINGNALIRVNGARVNLPYTFYEKGEYLIEITGVNNESEIFNIKVDKLTTTLKDNEEEPKISINQKEYKENPNLILTFEKNTNITKKGNNFLYLYLMPIISICIGLLLLKRRQR